MLLIGLTAVCFAACTPATRAGNAADLARRHRNDSPREVITPSEIAVTHGTTAFDLISRLRPEYLTPVTGRGALHLPNEPVVYVNDVEAGGVALLREISLEYVREVRYVAPNDAFFRHGERHRGGEIYLYIRRR
jgi:hypothetical protein